MQSVKKFIYFLGVLVFFGLAAYFLTNYYSWIFSKTVEGQIYEVERVTQPTMVVGDASVASATAMFSFAVAIKDKDGKIYTASSEDRQWAVAQKGLCVEAKFYPYPPWDLEKGGTYSNARLISLKECPPGSEMSRRGVGRPEDDNDASGGGGQSQGNSGSHGGNKQESAPHKNSAPAQSGARASEPQQPPVKK